MAETFVEGQTVNGVARRHNNSRSMLFGWRKQYCETLGFAARISTPIGFTPVAIGACEGISQAPAPFHVLPRGFGGPSLLAMILFEKYGQHQPLNRQAERYMREGVELSISTLAGQVGGCAAVLRPLYDLIRAHVFAGSRVDGDDTPVLVLAKGRTATGRAWVYVRDDRPIGGHAPPAAVFFYSRDRAGDHPESLLAGYAGILQADAYAGFNRLYVLDRSPGLIIEAACWAHARRKFFALVDLTAKARGNLPVVAPQIRPRPHREPTNRCQGPPRQQEAKPIN